MDTPATPHKLDPSVRDLFPELTDEQLKEAESNLRAYFEIVLEMCAAVDSAESCSTMEERSNSTLKVF
jgi:hypothetical protein